jgi:hypothetical protein
VQARLLFSQYPANRVAQKSVQPTSQPVQTFPLSNLVSSDVYFSGRKASEEILETWKILDQLKQELIANGTFEAYELNPIVIMARYTGLNRREITRRAKKIGFKLIPAREIRKQAMDKRWAEPEFRKKRSEETIQQWNVPGFRESRSEAAARKTAELMEDPDFCERLSETMTNLKKDRNFQRKHKEGQRRRRATPAEVEVEYQKAIDVPKESLIAALKALKWPMGLLKSID